MTLRLGSAADGKADFADSSGVVISRPAHRLLAAHCTLFACLRQKSFLTSSFMPAGIPLRAVVASCAAGFLDQTPLLDLNYIEDSGGGPDISVAMLNRSSEIVLLQMDNRLPLDTFESVVQLAMDGCKSIASFMRDHLLEHTQRLANARGLDRL